jgi:hypothetical protein
MGLMICAALVPAPAPVMPFIIVVCIGCPVFMAFEVPVAVAVLRATRSASRGRTVAPLDGDSLEALRSGLAELPETQHPLDR